ncbi:MAG TPA: IS66 family transposase [Methanotrichaceae archaeon]|nr:IS66 family transposase [Methanotrichaceae archaeon]
MDQQKLEIDQLRHENELLRGRIKELEALLAQYENAHTPPSLKRGGKCKKDLKDGSKGKPGQKIGHIGLTRPTAKPDRQVQVTKDQCPDCGAKLGDPFRIESKIIEEIPEPQPVTVTEYRICHYICPYCQKEVVGTDPGCPTEGRFGNNIIAQVALLKYEDRLPHRKIQDTLRRVHSLTISPATILDLTRRAADAVQSEYDAILNRIRYAPVLYIDETSIDVQGRNHWIWVFTTPAETFIVIRKSRGMKVLLEVLTREFKGTIVCDGWRSYSGFTDHIQRCWAHLLRESKDLAEKITEAVPLHEILRDLYDQIIDALKSDPPPKVRKVVWYLARARLNQLITREYADLKVKSFIGKISNGFEFWFTFVIQPGVEPTNNRAERALREHVVQRKIIGTLRNCKGTSIHERIMTVTATWSLQGLDSLKMLKIKLSS